MSVDQARAVVDSNAKAAMKRRQWSNIILIDLSFT
jgi:hypothetical protein